MTIDDMPTWCARRALRCHQIYDLVMHLHVVPTDVVWWPGVRLRTRSVMTVHPVNRCVVR